MLKRFIPIAIIVLWIVPVGWVGLMRSNYPLYPVWIAPLFRVSGVFESSPNRWRTFFIEVQDNSGWHHVDERALFAPTPLGNRTRFQQLMNDLEKPEYLGQTPKILHWIALHLPPENSSSPVKAVRIIHFGVPSETFLKCTSLADVYQAANQTRMARVIVASLNIRP